MIFNGYNVARILERGWAAAADTSPYDGYSAVKDCIGPDGLVRTVIPVLGHDYGLAAEVGGRAMNLLMPYPGVCCIHGLVKYDPADPGCLNQPHTACACGQEPIDRNPER